MNVIAIGLVVASMAFAGVWSPNAANLQGGEQVIVKGGHRAVVVEYDDDSGHVNTKVSISPPLTDAHHKATAEDHAASVSNDAKKAATEAVGPDGGRVHGSGAGEFICDAFGKCKHKITGAIYNTKNKVTDTAQEVEEGAKETVGSVIDKTKEAASKATETAKEGTGKAKETASRAKEAAEDTAEELKQKGKAAFGKAGEAVGDAAEKAKRTASRAGEAAEETVERAKKKGTETTKEMSDIAKRGKEVLHDATAWLIPRGFVSSLMGVVHLLGFATAYGTGVWVTFAMSHLLARSLPRQQFGVVQSRVYPIYFKVMAVSVGVALLGHLFGHRQPGASSVARTLQAYNLAGSIAMVLANLFYMEPRATNVMYERMKLEKEESRGVHQTTRLVDQTGVADTPLATTTTTTTTTTAQRREDGGEVKSKMERLTRNLRKLNSYSSLLNVMTLMGLTLHLVYLSQRLCL